MLNDGENSLLDFQRICSLPGDDCTLNLLKNHNKEVCFFENLKKVGS